MTPSGRASGRGPQTVLRRTPHTRVRRDPRHCTPCQPAVGSASTPASSWSELADDALRPDHHPRRRLVALAVGAQAQTQEIDARRARAEQGDVDAQYNLGVMYLNGQGVPQDYVLAHMWLNLAASRRTGEDRESAVRLRDLIAEDLTPDDLSEAQRLAREWDAAHPREP